MNITSAVMSGKSHPVLEFEYSRKGKVNIIKVLDLRKVYRFPRQWIVISDVVTALGTFSNGTTSRAIAAIPREHHFSSRVRFSGTQAGRRIGLVSYIGLLRFIRELSTFPTHNLKVWMRAVMIPELREYYESRRTMSITPAPTLDKPVKDKLVKARVVENPEGVTAGSEKEAWPDDVGQQETLPCTDLVRIDENQHVIVDSLMIAKQFSRLHKNVLQTIENLNCRPEFRRLNFQPSSYTTSQGKLQPMVTMTRDGVVFLVTSLAGSQAALWKERYITAFSRKEQELMSRIETLEATSASTALVPIYSMELNDDLVQTSNARELWAFMEVKDHFRNWIKARLGECLAVEGRDFTTSRKKVRGGTQVDYYVTLDTAKHIAMLERTEKGRIIRDYFIQCEKEWRQMKTQPIAPSTSSSIDTSIVSRLLDAMAQDRQMVLESHQALLQVVQQNQQLQLENHKLIYDLVTQSSSRYSVVQPPSHFTIVGYAALLDIQVGDKDASALGRKATRLCSLRKIDYLEVPDGKHGSIHSYPRDVLNVVFREYYKGHANFLRVPLEMDLTADYKEGPKLN